MMAKSMTNAELKKLLTDLESCKEAVRWVEGRTLAEAWAECQRADWMLWLAGRTMDRRLVVLATCAAVRPALEHAPAGEGGPRRAIETAEAWARGEATEDEVRAAASAASAAWTAAEAAAWTAAEATCAAGAAARAARAAARAADAARAAAEAAAHREMCDIVRSIIPDPDKAMTDRENAHDRHD